MPFTFLKAGASSAKPSFPDDRAEFDRLRAESSLAMGADTVLQRQAIDAAVVAEKHRYSYVWSWLGVPIIQYPPDIIATQEIIWKTKPDVIVETGIARGGSAIFHASMLTLIGKGKVVGVEFDLREHNRRAIAEHPMSDRITIIEGSSTDSETLELVKAQIPAGAKVMVVLDSNHSRSHVLNELRAYAPLVGAGQYIIVADTLLGFLELDQTPQRSSFWPKGDEPLAALHDFLKETDRFEVDPEINGKMLFANSPGGYVRCVKD